MRLSTQLYSLRAIPSLEAQLRLVRRAGLACVEATTANYADPALFRRLLDRFELSVPSGHVGIDRLRHDFEGTLALARRLDIENLFVWGLPAAEHWRHGEGWRRSGAELGGFARRFADAGLGFGFHNHDWELRAMEDGRPALAHLFEGAGGSPLQWQPDIAWLARGNADVDSLLSAHARLIRSAHVKDIARHGEADDEDGWADLGAGILPWRGWIDRLAEIGADLLVLEHDAPNDAERFLLASAAAARALTKAAANPSAAC